ncbi:HAMP domain-containing protein [Chloroflexota bacterium]
MKIYPKILLTTVPLVLLSLLAAAGVTYYLSFNALTNLAENWLDTRLSEAVDVAAEHEEVLHDYGLENLAASVTQAQHDAGVSMLTIEIGDLGHIFVVNSQGIVSVHPIEQLVGSDVSGEDWFQEVSSKQQGQLAYTWQGISHLASYGYFEPWEWHIFATDPQSEVYGAINQMGIFVLILGVVGSVTMALALMVLTRRLIAPLRVLVAGAEQVGQGDYDPDSLTKVATRTDELGQLTRVFQHMARQVYAREQRLKQQVRELKIVLDESRQNKKVAEITETDYFKSLQSEADVLRNIITGSSENDE